MREFIRLLIALHRLMAPGQGQQEKIRRLQEQRFRQLLAKAGEQSPFYRRKFRGIDLDRCSITELPTLTKSEMMANYDEFLTDRRVRRADVEAFIADPANLGKLFLDRYAVCHTSGSQGQPALILQDEDALLTTFAAQFVRGAVVRSRWFPHVSRLWSPARMALVTQRPGFYPSSAAFSYLPPAVRPFFKVLRLSVFDPVAETVARLNAFQPEYLTGYTSALEILAREEEAGRLHLKQSGKLQQITNISEPLPPQSAAWIEKVFGVRISDQYAMGECMALTCGCPRFSGPHINADLAILEVVDENYQPVPPGTAGSKVLMTNLYNQVQPFIRYEIDDVVTMSPEACACGSPLPRVASILGRSKDKLWIEVDGHYRELPYYIFLAGLHHDLDLAEHQVVQTGVNRFALRAAPQPGKVLSKDRLRQLVLQSVVSEGLGNNVRIDIEIVDQIPRGPSGKVNRVKNLFGPPPGPLDSERASA